MEPHRKSVRWIKASALSETEFADLQARIRRAKFKKRSGDGYLVDEMSSRRIRATYVERKMRSSEVIDPFGGIQRVEWFEFISYPFSFERESGIVEVVGSSRSLAPLIQQFGILTKWTSSFEPVVLEPKQVLDFLTNENERFDVTFLEFAGLTLSINASATVRATGRSSVLKDLKRMTGDRTFSISRITLQLVRPERPLEIDVSATGKVTVEGPSLDDGVLLCRRAVFWTLARGA